jgi:hypothetical protein
MRNVPPPSPLDFVLDDAGGTAASAGASWRPGIVTVEVVPGALVSIAFDHLIFLGALASMV